MRANNVTKLPLEILFQDVAKVQDVIIIDCRTSDEFGHGHIENAINIPLQHLSVRKEDLPCTTSDNVVVYCRTGNRSFSFATYLRSIGYDHCQSIAGGFEDWGDQTTC